MGVGKGEGRAGGGDAFNIKHTHVQGLRYRTVRPHLNSSAPGWLRCQVWGSGKSLTLSGDRECQSPADLIPQTEEQ